ncbi:MAG: DUF5895 domain-containing protein [Oscillatoriaceae bacterium SKW80]|nr:DUF5895 domain-containing protein [Oscillatoriaceae bacterium SKYG93]MCX8120163.1 DUF5895 domain-containing protein [Oscillatoriaceae bacterium SKW80]MDW8453089.1 DUF5895 domain-containing protein [Oscillatoriaceae cyanobacterium SKYGB_i_bin93]HIK29000.1 hypothetical protein [Oscillatoriaceae cyanobacterium M7585_C2015_266]
MKKTEIFDFDDEKFKAPPANTLPWCQMINPQFSLDGIKPYGLAIKLNQAQAAGFKPDENWQQIEHEFSNGNVATLFISSRPRLVIVRRGPICIKDRETGDNLGRLMDHYGVFKAARLKFKTFTRYLIFFVGYDKKFLHSIPLRLTLSGAAGVSFAIAYRHSKMGEATSGFTVDLEKAYAEYRNQPCVTKGPLFHAHGIFCPIFEAVKKVIGSNTVWICETTGYERPSFKNVTNYLIPSNSDESFLLEKIFEEYKDFCQEIPKAELVNFDNKQGISNDYNYHDEYDYQNEPPY